ncbi:MAG: 50S ribosomal protein L24 [Dehalococcoidia bacterium]|nr:50S ribosomal protein L24 [Dehalococcoidia bacterium]
MKVRKNDMVLVISGKDRGKTGKVRGVSKETHKVLVEGVNMVKRHMRPRPTVRQTGIVAIEAPIQASNLMLVCPKCSQPCRVGHKLLEDRSNVRVCRRCGETID